MTEGRPGQIGRYRILDELGRGGFGRVYRGYDPTMGRPVAVKVLTQVSEDTLTRFRNEATVAGNLWHKNIVTVYEYGTHGDLPFLAMEYLEGEDLHRIIASGRPLGLLEKCEIMSQAAEGLYRAHQSGVVHRDMKPANIMVLRDGTVKIMDFGIARLTGTPDATRLTQQGYLIGTLRYMAPEQLAGSGIDAQCDIFAYGVIFYELVTGRHPFEAPDAQSLIYKLTFDEPPPMRDFAPGVPDSLQQVVARIIHKDRRVRYQSLKDIQFDTEPIRIELRRGRAAALLSEAQELFAAEQTEPAQKLLEEALGLEPSNRPARTLWESVQQAVRQRSRKPRIESLLSAAGQHLAERRFAEALQSFESALALDPENESLKAQVERARGWLDRSAKASQLLAEARREFEEQNVTAANRRVSEALRHDPKNPDAAEFLKNIQAFVERRQAEQRVEDALRKAQGLMLIPAYDDAIAALTGLGKEAERPKVQELLERLRGEKAAHERKQRLRSEMAAATDLLREHRLEEAAECLENLQAEFPEDQEVAHLLTYAQKEQAAAARAKAIEEAATEARKRAEAGDFEGALAALDEGLKHYPGEYVLVRLLSGTMAAKAAWERQQAIEATLAECESLRKKKRFAEAVQAVEAVLEAHGAEPALAALREKLQAEWAQQRREEAVRRVAEQAETLMGQKRPEAALEAVQSALTRYPDEPGLGKLLRRAQEELRAKERALAVEGIGRQAAQFAAAHQFEQALGVLEQGLQTWGDDAALARQRAATLEAKQAWERQAALEEREREAHRHRSLQDLEEVRRLAVEASASVATGELLSLAASIASQYPGDEEIQRTAAEASGLLLDMERARRAIAAAQFEEALDICGRRLARLPEHAAFGELQQEAERARRRALVDELHRRASAEPDLRKRARILEEGLRRFPDETAIADELRFTRNKLELADSIVEKARASEQAGQWDEALEKWKTLVTIYAGYPGLEAEIARVERGRERALADAVEQRAREIEQAAAAGKRRLEESRKRAENLPAVEPAQAAAPGATVERRREGEQVRVPAATGGNRKRLLVAGAAAAGVLIAVLAVPRLVRGPGEIAVSVTANVSGAAVSAGGKNCVTPACTLKLAPGTYTLHATAAGHKAVERPFTIEAGQSATKMEVALEPLPQLVEVNTNFESGEVYLDGRRAGELRDGQYTVSGVAPGQHTIRVMGSGAQFEAAWRSTAGARPELLQLTSGRDVAATVVANAGGAGSIACNCDARDVTVDGAPAGQAAAGAGGAIPLENLKEGTRQIAVAGRSVVVEIGANPALNVFLSLDRNVGILIVETGEDKAKVFLNNRLYRRATEHGALRIPVDVGEYSVRVEKEGFAAPAARTVSLKKGEEKAVRFALAPALAHLEIGGAAAGAQVKVDGQRIGETDRNGGFRHEIAPGQHAIELSREEYEPARITEQFRPGQTVRLDRGRVAMARAASRAPDPKLAEAQEWTRIAGSTNPEDFDEFLRNHPSSAHGEQARARAGELRRAMQANAARQAEQAAWDKMDQGSREQLQSHLAAFPAGVHAQEARARIAELERQAAKTAAAQRVSEQQEQAKSAADEQAVIQVLREFDAAYNRRDLPSLAKLWNGVPVAAYRQQFREATDLKFQLQVIGRPAVNGNSAMAVCTRTLTYRGRSGGAQTHSERVTVTLSRDGSGWLIRSIQLN